MLQTLADAIQNKRVLEFIYDGCHRIVEPHAVGYSSERNLLLRCYQVEGQSRRSPIPDWRLMTVAKIKNLTVVPDRHFTSPRAGYKRGDSSMVTIYAQL
jgi:predicted DNA-binding transcriptional regulator YafY